MDLPLPPLGYCNEVLQKKCFTAHFLRVLFSFFFSPAPPSPSFLNPSPSSDLKTPPFPRENAIFRGWGAARVLEGVTPQKKKGISLKNGAQKLVSLGASGGEQKLPKPINKPNGQFALSSFLAPIIFEALRYK